MSRLPADLARRIRSEGGAVPFDRFMALALTEPDIGYYSRPDAVLGPRGDFTTAPLKSPAFVEGVARFLRELLDGLFTVAPGETALVLELGAGTGELAAGVLGVWSRRHPDLADRVAFRTVDASEHLRGVQRARLKPYFEGGWDAAVVAEPPRWPGPAIVHANELLDALPVQRVRVEAGEVEELWVALDPDTEAVREEWRPVGSGARAELELLFGSARAADLEPLTLDGQLELRPAVGNLIAALGAALEGPACLVWIDYGAWLAGPGAAVEPGASPRTAPGSAAAAEQGAIPEPGAALEQGAAAEEALRPVPHGRSIRAYFKHERREELYDLAGRQDLTADVDFRALDLHGAVHGFDRLLLTSLAAFLGSVGCGDELRRLAESEYSLERDAEAAVLGALLDEGDVGGLFKVMVQVREG